MIAIVSKSQSVDQPHQFLEFSTMSASQPVVKKLKIKIASKTIEVGTGNRSFDLGHQLSSGSYKRASDGMVDGHKDKKRKLDRSEIQQCSILLQELMTHPAGWAFNQPVDPITLNIPDYFSIITEPMDLGTVETKLKKHEYFSIEDFAAEVRLTFSNAMQYNPPDNYVHHMAVKLNNIFNTRWKGLEERWVSETTKVGQACVFDGRVKNTHNSRPNCQGELPSHDSLLPKRLMSADEKRELKKQLVEVLRGKLPQDLRGILKKLGLIFHKEDKVGSIVDAIDDETLWQLKRVLKSSVATRATQGKPVKSTASGGCQRLVKNVPKGTDSAVRSASVPAINHQTPSLEFSKCLSCGRGRCQCSSQNGFAHGSATDLLSNRSVGEDGRGVRMGEELKKRSTMQMSKSDASTDGEHVCSTSLLSRVASTGVSGEGCTSLIDVQLSPKKALRAAMLKSRFAGTILKAQHKTLLDHGDKADQIKMQREKETLEKLQLEETARIEAQIRAAEETSRLRAETEQKLQRERQREAARLALQKMEKTVENDNNLEILKDLEFLMKCSLSDRLVDIKNESEMVMMMGPIEGGGRFKNPLEQLGLLMKAEYIWNEDEDDILNETWEEGEILQ